MSLKTTELQFRQKHFKTIHRIIVENFGVSIQSENTSISGFLKQECDYTMFEYFIKLEFDNHIKVYDFSKISDILDQICQ